MLHSDESPPPAHIMHDRASSQLTGYGGAQITLLCVPESAITASGDLRQIGG
jgi:hypothetical protein